MTSTGYPAFDATVDKTNQVLKEIERSYGWPKERRQQSYAALRAVLHALRDRLTIPEAADLAAQLPVLIRGIYYEGWHPAHVPMKMSREQFTARVRRDFPFEIEGGIEQLIRTVLQAISRYVTPGEWEDIASSLPRDLAAMLPAPS